jgi:hypothetical protein
MHAVRVCVCVRVRAHSSGDGTHSLVHKCSLIEQPPQPVYLTFTEKQMAKVADDSNRVILWNVPRHASPCSHIHPLW